MKLLTDYIMKYKVSVEFFPKEDSWGVKLNGKDVGLIVESIEAVREVVPFDEAEKLIEQGIVEGVLSNPMFLNGENK